MRGNKKGREKTKGERKEEEDKGNEKKGGK